LENIKIDKSKKIWITAGASTPTDEIYKAGSLIKNWE
jgi:4-hydroxy-3-methylbut-2-enyl diphosphate reductase IspH